MPTRPPSDVLAHGPLSPVFSGFAADTLSWDSYALPSPGDSPRAASPMDDYAFEAQFCRDFCCCNIKLPSLHDLIQHYEERHASFDDELGLLDEWSVQGARAATSAHASKHAAGGPALDAHNPRKRKVSMNAHEPAASRKCVSAYADLAAGLTADELDEHLQRAIACCFDASSYATSTYGSESAKSPWLLRANALEPTLAVQPSQMNAVAAAAAAAVVSEVGGPAIVVPIPPPPAVATAPGRPAPPPATAASGATGTPEKPYKCDVPGCDKTYKNKNGLKYHILNGHIDPALKEAASQERRQQRLEERANRYAFYPQAPPPRPPTGAPAGTPAGTPAVPRAMSLATDAVAAAQAGTTSGLLTPPTPSSPQQQQLLPSPVKTVPLPTPASTAPPSPVEEVLKPYKCAVTDCGKTYKNLGGLKYHIDKVHDGNPLALAVGRKKCPAHAPAKLLARTASAPAAVYGALSTGLFVRVPEAVPHLQQKPPASMLSSTSIVGAGMLPAPLPSSHTTAARMPAAHTGRL